MLELVKIKKDIAWILEQIKCLFAKGTYATAWSADHTLLTGGPYLKDTIVWYQGSIYKAKHNNESELPTNTIYWECIGEGFLLEEKIPDWWALPGTKTFIKNKPTKTSDFLNDGEIADTPDPYASQQYVLERIQQMGGVTKTSELLNDGEDGTHPFITLEDIPSFPDLSGFVPYIGATSNLDLGEFQLLGGQITFDQSPTQPAGVRVLRWNDSDGTLDLGLKGGNVTLQLGQETVVRVVNKTATNLTEAGYQVVYISGAQGQRLKVDLAIATSDLTSAGTIGLVTENISVNQEGFITSNGLVRGVNTTGSLQGEVWQDGDMLYLSPTIAGRVTNIKPVAPYHTVVIGVCVHAHINQGSIFVKVDNGYELEELHNVLISTPLDNEILSYETSSGLWKNKSLSSLGGISGTGTLNYLPKFTGTGSLGDSLIYDDGVSVLIGTTVNDTLNKLQVNGGISIKELSSYNVNLVKSGLTINPSTISTDGTVITDHYGIKNSLTLLNSGVGFSGQYLYGNYMLNTIGGQTAGSKVVAYGNYTITRRADATDVSAHVNNELRGNYNFVTHGQTISDTAYTKIAYGVSNVIANHSGVMSESFGTSTTLNVGTIGSKISTIGTYYGLDLRANIGNATSTATVTNYYALYHPAIVLAGTGAVTNRWGLYLSDPLMKNHIVGTTLIGTAVDNGIDKLQVKGTIFASAATTSNQVVIKSQLDLKQNTLPNSATGVGSEVSPITYALQDGTILYHSVKWFVPTSTVSTSGTTVTSVGTQFTSAMVGAKLIVNGEWRIITAYTNTTNVTVSSAYSQNYSSVVASSWGVYSRCLLILSSGTVNNYSYQGVLMFAYAPSDQNNVRFLGVSMNDNSAAVQPIGVLLKDTLKIFWSSDGTYYGTKDLGLRRNAAGVLEIYDGITATGLEANRRDLLTRNIFGSKVLIGTTVDAGYSLDVQGSSRHAGNISAVIGSAVGHLVSPSLTATANNDVLVGLDIAPTFTNGAFTGVKNYCINMSGNASINGFNQINLVRGGSTVFGSSSLETNISTISPTVPLKLSLSAGALVMGQISPTTGNFILQNGGTFTDDAVNRLQVSGSIKSTSSVQVGDNALGASLTNVGAIRYRSDANNSYMDMVMQTGVATYAWVNIKTNTW